MLTPHPAPRTPRSAHQRFVAETRHAAAGSATCMTSLYSDMPRVVLAALKMRFLGFLGFLDWLVLSSQLNPAQASTTAHTKLAKAA